MNSTLTIERYSSLRKTAWDELVKASASGTFLLLRDYMEYHSERFEDFSLLVLDGEKVLALLPANREGERVVSHGGLTYGGVVARPEMSSTVLLDVFDAICHYLREAGIKEWIYKCVPYIYRRYPQEGERYALYRLGAVQEACNLSSAVDLSAPLRFAELRRRGVRRAEKAGIEVAESGDYAAFWEILSSNLQERYGRQPVHTLAEIELLHSRFPDNIKLYTATHTGEVVAGGVVYDTEQVAHAQYISASAMGKSMGALDLLFAHLIEKVYASHRYFDFGISTEQGGEYLNVGLLAQKEGFGARGVTYDIYRIAL